eukprot:gene7351-biopygen72411
MCSGTHAPPCATEYPSAAPEPPVPPCRCSAEWSSPRDGGNCELQYGCPAQACDNDGSPWCVAETSPCIGEEQEANWFYCSTVTAAPTARPRVAPPSRRPTTAPSAAPPTAAPDSVPPSVRPHPAPTKSPRMVGAPTEASSVAAPSIVPSTAPTPAYASSSPSVSP